MNSGAAFSPCPAARRRRSTLFTCAIVAEVRVAGVVRATSSRAAHAVRRCPMAAVNWYSQPGTVLLEPLQRQAPLCTCSRPGEHHAPGRGYAVASTANRSRVQRAHASRTCAAPSGDSPATACSSSARSITSRSAIHSRASGPSTACGSSAASRENSPSSSIRPALSASYRAP